MKSGIELWSYKFR